MPSLTGQAAVVTGGAQGVGYAIAQRFIAEVPMRRAGQPDEVAEVALFLASGLSSYMTGTVLEVTGGRFM